MAIGVTGNIAGAQPHEDGSRVPSQRVKIGFFLKDTLKVIDEDGEVTKEQCCYEQKTVTIYSSQVNDLDRIKQLAYRTLHDDMNMDSESAEEAKSVVATTIRDKVLPARNSYPRLSTILLEIRVACTIEKRDEEAGDPSGEHGYDRLLERLDDDDCPICRSEFDSTDNIVVTACHHTYHRSCLFQLLCRSNFSCPMCRSDLAPIIGGALRF
ncbi:E3 ubiquitin-protein ligase [Nymphaea thermarum]|nr:E3 ubiquitin-protein ligase [Nymphaea thermarum]